MADCEWYVHISCADELEDASSEEAAQKRADELNAWFDSLPKNENTPNMKATVGFRRLG